MPMTYLQMQDRVMALGGYGEADRDRIKTFINMTKRDLESRHGRFSWLEKQATINTVAGTATVALPSDLNTHGRLTPTTTNAPAPRFVEPLSFEHDSDDHEASTTRGVPQEYTVRNGTYIFRPIPDAVYTYTVKYWKFSAELTGNSDTTDIPETHEDILIYGALMHHAARDKDPQMMAYWQDMYEGKVRSLRFQSKQNQYDNVNKIPLPAHYYGSYDY